jgi:hypothetical protein
MLGNLAAMRSEKGYQRIVSLLTQFKEYAVHNCPLFFESLIQVIRYAPSTTSYYETINLILSILKKQAAWQTPALHTYLTAGAERQWERFIEASFSIISHFDFYDLANEYLSHLEAIKIFFETDCMSKQEAENCFSSLFLVPSKQNILAKLQTLKENSRFSFDCLQAHLDLIMIGVNMGFLDTLSGLSLLKDHFDYAIKVFHKENEDDLFFELEEEIDAVEAVEGSPEALAKAALLKEWHTLALENGVDLTPQVHSLQPEQKD